MKLSIVVLLAILYDVTLGQYATRYGGAPRYSGEPRRPVEVDLRGIVIGKITSKTYQPDMSQVPPGASSLAFVFDITGSMWDDLKQVTAGAKQILETTLGRQEQPLHDYILVPFHDPQVGPVTVTTDPDRFEQSLRNLYIQGGGDCPEMSITAIREALLISLPGSFIYVFTDARSKDYFQLPEILKIIQRKQSQVVFVLTGDCENQTHDGYKAYERIAATSSGQVFFITKDDVSEVVKFIEVSVQAQKVVLHATDHSESGRNEWTLPFDPELQEITIAVSGPGRDLQLYDPSGLLIDEENGMEILLNLDSVLIANIKTPQPGVWRVITESTGEHSLRVTGLSTLDFQARFSRWPTLDWEHADFQPVSEMDTFTLLNATGLTEPGRLETLSLVDAAGVVKKRIRLSGPPDPNMSHIYSVDAFVSPDYPYYLVVHGVTHDGYRFVRASKNAIINVAAEKPQIEMLDEHPGYFDNPAEMECKVSSLLPFDLKWSRYVDDQWIDLTPSISYMESASDVYRIEEVTDDAEGRYRCYANNSLGYNYADTFLDVEERPPIIELIGNVSVTPGGNIILTCNISSNVEYNVRWVQKGKRYLGSRRFVELGNGSLIIKQARRSDEGIYECIVTNIGGTTTGEVPLLVQIPPTVQVRPTTKSYFKTGDTITMTCVASGHPVPELNWLKASTYLFNVGKIRIKRRGRTFELINAQQSDEGVYTCQATSRAGSDATSVSWVFTSRPTVDMGDRDMLVLEGNEVLLGCHVEGTPAPAILWYKSRRKIVTDTDHEITEEGLLIHEISVFDQGDYQCIATNRAGSTRGNIRLTVGRLPFFIKTPEDVGVDLGQTVTMPCSADGNPRPVITWKRGSAVDHVEGLGRARLRGGTNELYINGLQLDDEGLYTCVATNQFGSVSQTAQLTVTGTSLPRIEPTETNPHVLIGDSLMISCKIISGTPIPSRRWLKDGEIFHQTTRRVSLNRNGNIMITGARASDAGAYVCEATNPLGEDRIQVDVDVWTSPVIVEGPTSYSTVESFEIIVACETTANPAANIEWRRQIDDHVITGAGDDDGYVIGEDGSLTILHPGDEDRGKYSCFATNPAGVDSIVISLEVYIRPLLDTKRQQTEYTVVVGDGVTLDCAMTPARPAPNFVWLKDGERLVGDEKGIVIDPSGYLVISTAALEHDGQYQCVASNIAGRTDHEISLDVWLPPAVRTDQRIIKILEEETAMLSCQSTGVPTPSIDWYLDGYVIDENYDYRYEVVKNVGRSQLRITRAQLGDDGDYICVGDNIAGHAEDTVRLDIQKLPQISGNIVCPPVTQSISGRSDDDICLITPLEHSEYRVPCNATGDPKPIIRWFHDGRQLTGGEENIDIDDEGTLIFRDITSRDNGAYTCLAENERGDIRKVVEILVHERPEIVGSDGGVEHITVLDAEDIELNCETSAVPPPRMTWYRGLSGEEELHGEANHQIFSPSRQRLHIEGATISDTGVYLCIATNQVGENRKSFRLDVYVPPTILHNDDGIEKHVVVMEDSVTLRCEISGIPYPNIRWYKGASEIGADNERVIFGERKQTLHIEAVQVTDTSTYFCIVRNVAGEERKDFSLHVHVPPSIKGRDSIYTIVEFNSLSLECLASGIPDPVIEWSKDGHLLTPRPGLHFSHQMIEFSSIRKNDEGRFECQATNDAGAAFRRYDVIVQVPPRIGGSDAVNNHTVVLGGTIKLHCDADGDPPPMIRWMKDGIPFQQSTPSHTISDHGETLTIEESRETDAGRYECVAYNEVGEEVIRHDVDVLVPPRITGGSDPEVQVIEHETTTLECQVYGHPFPQVRWEIYGEEVDDGRTHNRGQMLVIDDTLVSDANHYTCVVSNHVGRITKDIHLTVYVPPQIIQPSSNGMEHTVIEENRVELLCVATGIPVPTLTWLKDGQPVDTSQVMLNNENQVLVINSAYVEEHEGSYECVASNIVGEDYRTMSLVVHVPPEIQGHSRERTKIVESGRSEIMECRLRKGKPTPEIRWYNGDNQLIETGTNGYLLTNSRQRFHVLSARLNDVGTYWCDASNIAGSSRKYFNLKVIVAPHINGEGEVSRISVIINHDVTLECRVQGIPTPNIIWMKDGVDVGVSSRQVQFSAGGTRLTLSNAVESDAGSYSCQATNDAGNSTKEYSLEVYLPPSAGNEDIENITVTENNPVILECDVQAFPPPVIQWFKNSRAILLRPGVHISEDGYRLQIQSANERDTGMYYCEAVNIAGKEKKQFRLTVNVIPVISGLPHVNLEHVVGDRVRMDCEVDGIPRPLTRWSGGRLDFNDFTRFDIQSDGRHIFIDPVQLDDSGTYVCEASNDAGEDEKTFNLVVHQPPEIEGEDEERIIVNKGDNFVLECIYTGFPTPTISWLKNQRPLVPAMDRARLIDGRLVVDSVDMDDTGKYKCVASNDVGISEKRFTVEVRVPPTIRNGDEIEKKWVSSGSNVSLSCEASGVPQPQLHWLVNGLPLQPTPTIRPLSAGRVLRIINAQDADAASYTCVATNVAGVASHDIILDVYSSPHIIGGDDVDNNDVNVGEPFKLECSVQGFPQPDIEWLKDGRLIATTRSDSSGMFGVGGGYEMSLTGRYLIVASAQLRHSGDYTCQAVNKAGGKNKKFHVNIRVPPSIDRDNSSPKHVTTYVNTPTTLRCAAYGTPTPTVTWIKDGEELEVDNLDKYKLQFGNRNLRIANTLLADEGEYTCVASNPAGEATLDFNLYVQVPPKIEGSDQLTPDLIEVKAADTFQLSCLLEDGNPQPNFIWTKGRTQVVADGRRRFYEDGQMLSIDASTSQDTGRYRCTAVNEAGEDDKVFDVEVQTLPSFDEGDNVDVIDVNEGSPFHINCKISAVPQPKLSWLKDGQPIEGSDGGRVIIYPDGRTLQVLSARSGDGGDYECVAENKVGSDSKKTQVLVNFPPSIVGNHLIEIVRKVLGSPFTLRCDVSGSPTPEVTWYKNAVAIDDNLPKYDIANDGQDLLIRDAELSDSGLYDCRAKNKAGQDNKAFRVQIQIKPTIYGAEVERREAFLNTPVVLACDASGIPTPSLHWEKDGEALSSIGGSYQLIANGRFMMILAIQREDDGVYTCTARNEAGEDSKSFELITYVAPVLPTTSGEITVDRGETAVLSCTNDAKPTPVVQWTKNGDIIKTDDRVDLSVDGQILTISIAQESDGGRYVCVVSNKAGIQTKNFKLNINVPPTISGPPVVDIATILGHSTTLECDVYAHPSAQIEWMMEGSVVTGNGHLNLLSGGEKLQIGSTDVTDSGRYTCFAENPAGSAQKLFRVEVLVPPRIFTSLKNVDVIEGGDATFECDVTGNPVPQVTWYINGVKAELDGDDDSRYLTMADVQVNEGGKVICKAENVAGMEHSSFSLRVFVPPTVADNSTEIIEVTGGQPAALECNVQGGIPPPQITWFRHSLPLQLTDRLQLFNRGRILRISQSQEGDTGEYTCVAVNEAGQVEDHSMLNVYVPPTFTSNGDEIALTVMRGETFELDCSLYGVPQPDIAWNKDSTPLLNLNDVDRVMSVANAQKLRITGALVEDTGRYTCLAISIAGKNSKNFNVQVYDHVTIESQYDTLHLTVNVGESLHLDCNARGIPPPTLRWMKNGDEPILDSSRVLDNGRRFRIESAALTDSGTYVCLATSPSGSADKTYDVTVNLPPTIDGVIENVVAVVGENVTLTCRSNAVPPPIMSWYRLGSSLDNGEKDLKLRNVQIDDSGIYTCIATNIAGTTSQDIHLNIYAPPYIHPGLDTIIVNENDYVKIPCVVDGKPKPRVMWRHEGVLLQRESSKFLFDEEGLVISHVNLEDGGKYYCLAANNAGSDKKITRLLVHVPPIIESGSTNVTVLVNNPVTLECEVYGVPTPTVSWEKDGEMLQTNSDPSYSQLDSGSLRISSVSVSDAGRYECTASNTAGTSHRNIALAVQVPPSITGGPSKFVREPGSSVRVPCQTSGIPTPSVSWMNEESLVESSGDIRVDDDGTLVIPVVEVHHDGVYTCIAQNNAGMARYETALEVRLLPQILTDELHIIAQSGEVVTLPCETIGIPYPTVIWRKGAVEMDTMRNETIISSDDGSLQFPHIQPEHAGMYTCIAQNLAGVDSNDVIVEVYTPPQLVIGFPDEIIVMAGEPLVLPVHVSGFPLPKIKWSKGNEVIVSVEGTLQIPVVTISDAGKYTMTATNDAGFVIRHIRIIVQAAPLIRVRGAPRIVISEGESFRMSVDVRGIPAPTVRWFKENEEVDVNVERVTLLSDGSLHVNNALQIDAGHYLVEALNVVGRTTTEFELIVHVAPIITEAPHDTHVRNGESVRLVCQASGYPTPTLTWRYLDSLITGGRISISSLPGHSVLAIDQARIQDSGMYMCEAANPAGKRMAVAFVTVDQPPEFVDESRNPGTISRIGDDALLHCLVRADPKPTITWTKDGKEVPIGERIRVFKNGSLALFDTLLDDAGDYTCIATNDAGSAERTFTLTLQMPPRWVVRPQDTTVDVGETFVLNCVATGVPRPAIIWFKASDPVVLDERVTVLRNNSLRVVASRLDDTNSYFCIVSNFLGAVNQEAGVVIRVNGGLTEWSSWGSCSSSCGVGGIQGRMRFCINPAPANGGTPCPGESVEEKGCHQVQCPIDGSWSEWQEWEDCSVTCGQGFKSRTRECNSPPAQYGGLSCEGESTEQETCDQLDCAVNGIWSNWGPWLPCSSTCGESTQNRLRYCNNPAPSGGGQSCFGSEQSSRLCNLRPCPVNGNWAIWSSWGICSASCGGGLRSRMRSCSNPEPINGGQLCAGSNEQVDNCNIDPCSVNGNWAGWGGWSDCSRTCGGGQMNRYRSCTDPPPRFGGRFCGGSDAAVRGCGLSPCPIDGRWSDWTTWSTCSRSCGPGDKSRQRFCNNPTARHGGASCVGDTSQTDQCLVAHCQGTPRETTGILFGTINNTPFGGSPIFANGTKTDDKKTKIYATIHSIPPTVGAYLKSQVSILTPIYWTVAREIDGAYNGYSLTKGFFDRNVMVEFPAGEIVRMQHKCSGLDSDGKLIVQSDITGEVPEVDLGTQIDIKDYTEDYIQTGPGSIYAFSDRLISLDSFIMPYTWNHSISYNSSFGRMPYLVETLSARNIQVRYDLRLQQLHFTLEVSIAPSEYSDTCPFGFALDSTGQYCNDENECEMWNPCSHSCVNVPGSFICNCPPGYTVSTDGRSCDDIDECSTDQYACDPTYECLNTLGSYKCVITCEVGMVRADDVCEDIDECEQSRERVCDHTCTNTIGSYRCECRFGYRKFYNGKCRDINECRRNVCRKDQKCRNTQGGYRCIDDCPAGMRKNAYGDCVDTNECSSGLHNCGKGMICENTQGGYNCVCPPGFKASTEDTSCIDLDECKLKPTLCQFSCNNTEGSFRCLCPVGYSLSDNGRNCQDINECGRGTLKCPSNRMCFNQRGSATCIDTPCPPSYTRAEGGHCVKRCTGPACDGQPRYAIEYKTIALPYGIAPFQDLVRLSVYSDTEELHMNTRFSVRNTYGGPFNIRNERHKGVLFTTAGELQKSRTYHIEAQATSYSKDNSRIEYYTKFIIYINVGSFNF